MLNIQQISSEDAPPVVGPYSVAIRYADLVFCSGQIGLNPKTGNMEEGIEKQTEQVLKNLEAALKASDSDFEHVLKTTIYLANMDDYAKVNEIYGNTFSDHKPARATVQVAALPRAALIEIDAIAAVAFEGTEECECECGCDCDEECCDKCGPDCEGECCDDCKCGDKHEHMHEHDHDHAEHEHKHESEPAKE